VAVAVKEGDTSIQRTVAWQLSGSEAPGFQSAALRRVARPRGPINRRALTPAVVQNQTLARPMVKLLQTLPPVNRVVITVPPRIFVGRMATIRSISDAANTPHIDQARLAAANFNATVRPPVLTIHETQGQGFRAIDDGGRRAQIDIGTRQAAVAHLSKLRGSASPSKSCSVFLT
jgi:hypothetical protein